MTGYRSKNKEEKDEQERPRGNVDVYFHKQPEWTMASVEEAEGERQCLKAMKVRVGVHSCEFSIEELPEGNFAIVCLAHPDWSKPE